jgi:hypothetical protein
MAKLDKKIYKGGSKYILSGYFELELQHYKIYETL